MKINDIIEVKIEKMVFGGEAIAYYNNLAIFVPMSIPGDIVKVKIISIKKTYARAIITEIVKASPDRINDDKISFEDYSGCDFAMLSYENQIKYKKEILTEVINKIGKLNIDKIEVVSSNDILNYRNKIAEPFVKTNSIIYTGFYSKKSHNIFIAKDLNLRSKIASILIEKLLFKLNEYNGSKKEFKVYNYISKNGFLKNCVIRNNEKNELMLIIVVNKKSKISLLSKLLISLYKENENLKSIYISIKEKDDNVIFGETFINIIGDKYITEEIMGISFKIYPDSFFQINKKQAIRIYNDALNLLGNYENLNLIDAFSGTGTLAMLMAKKAKKVIGIEYTKSSVDAAILTAKENNIENVKFICSKFEEVIEEVIEENDIKYILFDPPRKGIDKEALEYVARNKIEKIVYISCNPATLARDIKILKDYSYELKFIKGYDMFPQTHHIEVLALLENKS